MKIKNIQWRNFASYGNKINQINFDSTESNFYIVQANNGSGKSSINDALQFGIYGKVANKKLSDLPNRLNSNLWVRVELVSNGKNILIERGIQPTFSTLKINGEEWDKANKKSIDEYLEELLDVPFYVFSNTLSLSINDFKSFISLSPADKKSIFDKIFSFHILNIMKERVKALSKKNKETYDSYNLQIQGLQSTINRHLSEIQKLTLQLQSDKANKSVELQSIIDSLKVNSQTLNESLQSYNNAERTIGEDANKWVQSIRSLSEAKALTSRKIALYKNNVCPECESNLSTSEHVHRHETLNDELQKLDEQLADDSSELEKIKTQIELVRKQKAETSSKISEIGFQLNQKIDELNKLNSIGDNHAPQIASLTDIKTEMEQKSEFLSLEKLKSHNKGLFYDTLESILGDDGVKKIAIKTILPSLNSEIAKLLLEVHINHVVKFNENFDAIITHLGQEIRPGSLSTGQRKKIDFCVLISIIRIMKRKYPGLNILFLDEIFASIDSDGIHSILKILASTVKEYNINTFVINHAPLEMSYFDYKVGIDVANNFSNLYIEKING